MPDRPLDVICIGRSSVDLYGNQVGGRLEDMLSFSKYLGGCPTNISVGTSRLGLNSALITRVGNEQMGRFIVEGLGKEGVDTSQITTDSDRLTALVILGIRDKETFPHIFYRENCADMALSEKHISEDFIASAKAIVVTGTHFSTPEVDAASRKAMAFAKKNSTKIVFDIDYRPVFWGLSGHADGESRFVESGEVTKLFQTIFSDCDLIVGTEEEVHIAGGSTDTLVALRNIRKLSGAVIVLKRGAEGCVVYPDKIPHNLNQGIVGKGFEVDVLNTLGAGDGFMSGFLRGWLTGGDWETCCTYANATGALVVSRHGCSPASPSWDELSKFISQNNFDIEHTHRASTRYGHRPEIHTLAFDHRSQLEDLADECGADRNRISDLKLLIAEAVQEVNSSETRGILVDDTYGLGVLDKLTGSGWWIGRPVEKPGSRPLEFEKGNTIGLTLLDWPAEHIAKCLVYYHPDDDEDLKQEQINRLSDLCKACCRTEHELLIEVIAPTDMPKDDFTILESVREIYQSGIKPDWWKLPPPVSNDEWSNLSDVIIENDPYCRGVVLLGLNAPTEELKKGFAIAGSHNICKGFAVGRSIFQEPAKAWLLNQASDEDTVTAISKNYSEIVMLWNSRRGQYDRRLN